MPANTFSTGRDCQLVLIGPGGPGGQAGSRVDLTHVTGFESKQNTRPLHVDRLDGVFLSAQLPKGWEGFFELERGSPAADDFIAALEQAWYAQGQMLGGTLYQYIAEVDGSVSTYQYDGVVFRLENSGHWRGDSVVKQKLHFFASRRTRV